MTRKNLSRHITVKHTDLEPSQCCHCQKLFKSDWSLKEHERVQHGIFQSASRKQWAFKEILDVDFNQTNYISLCHSRGCEKDSVRLLSQVHPSIQLQTPCAKSTWRPETLSSSLRDLSKILQKWGHCQRAPKDCPSDIPAYKFMITSKTILF